MAKLKIVTKTEAISIVNKFIKEKLSDETWFEKIKPYIKAIILYGSVAKKTNRPDSDIDFLIITPLHIEEKYTKGEYFYAFEDHEINIVLRSIERLKLLAESEPNEFEAEVFRNCEFIASPDDEVKKLIDKITAKITE